MDGEPVNWTSRTSRPAAQSATVSLGDGREFTAMATNVSSDGCQIVAEERLSVGETLVLSLPERGTIQAQVRWTADDRAGIRFVTEDLPEQRRA